MTEKQPVRLDSQSINHPKEGVKPFRGSAIHGVFMGTKPEPTDSDRKNFEEKISSIQKHLN